MRILIADDEQNLAADLRCRMTRLWSDLEIVAVVPDGLLLRSASA